MEWDSVGLAFLSPWRQKKKYISKYNSKLPSQILYIATGRDCIKVIVHITSANKDVFQNVNACISLNYTFKNMIKDYIKCRHISVAEDWWSSKKLPESSAGLDNSVHFKWSLLIISAKGLATWTILCCGYWVFTVDGFHFFLAFSHIKPCETNGQVLQNNRIKLTYWSEKTSSCKNETTSSCKRFRAVPARCDCDIREPQAELESNADPKF